MLKSDLSEENENDRESLFAENFHSQIQETYVSVEKAL